MADRITLTGVTAFGRHGVLDEEKRQGQNFVVDANVWLDFPVGGDADDLDRTVNYAQLAELITRIVEGEPRDLIETVATEIADSVMGLWPIAHAVEVTVHKPQAPIPVPFDDVAVTARRSRKGRAGYLGQRR